MKKNATNTAKFCNGNVKIGDLLSFNKLAGNTEFKGCMGSCKENAVGCWNTTNWKKSPCYVAKSYVQYKDHILDCHIVNTLAMRTDPWGTVKILNDKLQKARKKKNVRQHSSGEFESAEELKAWMWLAKKNPERKFYVYTKAYKIVDEVLSVTPQKDFPKNYFINISIWHEAGIECYNRWKKYPNVKAFVYDDEAFDYTKAGIKPDCYCPAYKKGLHDIVKLSHDVTCDKCQLCFKEIPKVIACWNH